MRNVLIGIWMMLSMATPALAGLNIVATLPWIGSLAGEIGGGNITVTTLVKPNQDPHRVEAKPSMILAGRKADVLMYNGLDLEIGYLPLILESARNSKVVPGKPGNFDCSRFVQVIEKPTATDRSLGDVHPLGNPHYHFSPANMLRVAAGMTDTFAELDTANAASYRRNFQEIKAKFDRKQNEWRALNLQGKRFVAYHRLFEYLAPEFGITLAGYVEPKPGIPPSAGYLESLIERMKQNRPDGILTTGYYGKNESDSISGRTGVKLIVLPGDVGAMEGTDDWFAFMDTVLNALK
jgi:zinc/manganese transport system substrate-binding protein